MRIISDLIGTMQSFFKIGTLRLKNNSNVLEVRNSGDSGYLPAKMSTINLNNGSGNITLQSAASGTVILTLPTTDGNTGEVLKTDGNGVLDWVAISTESNAVKTESQVVAYNTASPVSVFTPPANSVIQKVFVTPTVAFNGTPAMSVGVAGSTSRYMGTTDIDLTDAALPVYEVTPMYTEDASPEEVIVTLSAGGASAGSCIVSIVYANPS